MRMSIGPWIPSTTCTTVLATVSEVLQSSDFDIMIWPQRTKEQREAMKKFALEHPPREPSPTPESYASNKGLPIRTPIPKYFEPSRPTPEIRDGLRNLAKEMMEMPDRQPYIQQATATITDRTIPVVSGRLQLRCVDADDHVFSDEDLN
jgi:hypothetical protein